MLDVRRAAQQGRDLARAAVERREGVVEARQVVGVDELLEHVEDGVVVEDRRGDVRLEDVVGLAAHEAAPCHGHGEHGARARRHAVDRRREGRRARPRRRRRGRRRRHRGVDGRVRVEGRAEGLVEVEHVLEQRRPPAREGRVREVAQRRDRAAAVEGRRFREAQDAVDDAVGPRGGERRLLEGLRLVESVALRRPGRPRGRELRRPREAARRDPAAALDGRALRRRGLERGADPPEPRVRRRRGAELVGRAAPRRRDGRHGLDGGAARELEGRPRREDGHVLGREVARVGDGRPVVGRPLAQGRGRDDAAAAHREAAAPRGRRGRGRPAPALAVLEVAAGLRRRLEERVARREDARVRAVADADGRPRDGQRQAPERGLADLRGAVQSRNTHETPPWCVAAGRELLAPVPPLAALRNRE